MSDTPEKTFYDETHTVFGHHENKLFQWIFFMGIAIFAWIGAS